MSDSPFGTGPHVPTGRGIGPREDRRNVRRREETGVRIGAAASDAGQTSIPVARSSDAVSKIGRPITPEKLPSRRATKIAARP